MASATTPDVGAGPRRQRRRALELARVYDDVLALFRYRGYRLVDAHVPATGAAGRAAFYVVARAADAATCAVALFADVRGRALYAPNAVEVTPAAVEAAVIEAERHALAGEQLRLVLLRADGAREPSKDVHLELWHVGRELALRVPEHELTPRHWLVRAPEHAPYPDTSLPRMHVEDPAARWLGARVDDVVGIEDVDCASGVEREYRLVVL